MAADFFGVEAKVSGFGRIVFIAALLTSGLGIGQVRAQTVLGDPRDAAKIFASNCSACHKSPQGLAKSGQVAGFLRQHYTTGAEMSAAMAAYLVAAGSGPASKKTAAAAENAAAKTKSSKKGEQLAARPQAEPAEATKERTLRGKQRAAKAHEEPAAPLPEPRPVTMPESKEAVSAALETVPTTQTVPVAATPSPPVVLDLPLPPMPEGPPPELSQSVFSSSPLP